MKLFILGISVFALFFFFTNCSDSDTAKTLILTEVNSRCLPTAASDCRESNENALVFIGMTDNKKVSCEDIFINASMGQLFTFFEASSIVKVNFSDQLNSLTANFNDWTGADGLGITVISNTNKLVCSYIDTNRNSLLDAQEPILETTVPAQDFKILTLEAWKNY